MRNPQAPFPTKLKAGCFYFKIEDWHTQEAASASRYGETSHLLKRIRVDRQWGARQAAATLFHEICHVAYTGWDVQKGDEEERVVEKMETAITSMWRDNPEVFAYIAYHLCHDD